MVKLTSRLTVAVLVMLGFASWPAWAKADQAPRTIAVTGVGQVQAKPDMATMSAGVTILGDTAKQAVADNSELMQTILKAMKSFGIDERDMQTSNFSVSPRYSRPDRNQAPAEIIGYQVSNTVVVIVRDIDSLGQAIDKFVSAGANDIRGVQFGFSQPQVLEDQARVKAVEDARRKAGLFAETAGVEIDRVVRIEELGASTPAPFMARAEMMSSVPIAPGEETVTARVNVTFGIR